MNIDELKQRVSRMKSKRGITVADVIISFAEQGKTEFTLTDVIGKCNLCKREVIKALDALAKNHFALSRKNIKDEKHMVLHGVVGCVVIADSSRRAKTSDINDDNLKLFRKAMDKCINRG